MDCRLLMSYKSKFKTISEEQIELADKKYLSSVYFHTLFLFTIAKQKKLNVTQEEKEIELTDFLKIETLNTEERADGHVLMAEVYYAKVRGDRGAMGLSECSAKGTPWRCSDPNLTIWLPRSGPSHCSL